MAGWLAEFNELGVIDWTPTSSDIAAPPRSTGSLRPESGR
jgi:hypothetical protein